MAVRTKTQQATLAVLRGLLRHVRTHVDNRPPAVLSSPVALQGAAETAEVDFYATPAAAGKRDISLWKDYIVGQYRANQSLASKAEARQLRTKAADALRCFEATREQRELIDRYRGGDVDAQDKRKAVARFVGLEVPKTVPLGKGDASEVAARYAASIAARLSGASSQRKTELTGIDHIKAQLYGVGALAPGGALSGTKDSR